MTWEGKYIRDVAGEGRGGVGGWNEAGWGGRCDHRR